MCFLRKKFDKARDLLIQTKTLPTELIIAKMSLIKFYCDISRPEDSANFLGFLSLHQNTLTKRFKNTQNAKTSWRVSSIFRQCVQKWNKLPQWLRLAKNENVFKKTLNNFLLSQHLKIPLNSNVGAFKSYFIFRKKTIGRNSYNVILQEICWCILFYFVWMIWSAFLFQVYLTVWL